MIKLGLSRRTISELFNVLESYISRWYCHYKNNQEDASSLLLTYQGSNSYLSDEEKASVIKYLESQTTIRLVDFKKYLASTYGVKYKSDQSYYDLLNLGKMSWKKTQKKILKKTSNR